MRELYKIRHDTLLAALKNAAIDKRSDLTEEEENAVVMKESKQLKETLSLTPADRTDIIEECQGRIAVLSEFAPKIMDEAEISSIPEIDAKHVDAQIIHEAAIGRINDEQLVKLRTFGMNVEEAESVIIESFLK